MAQIAAPAAQFDIQFLSVDDQSAAGRAHNNRIARAHAMRANQWKAARRSKQRSADQDEANATTHNALAEPSHAKRSDDSLSVLQLQQPLSPAFDAIAVESAKGRRHLLPVELIRQRKHNVR